MSVVKWNSMFGFAIRCCTSVRVITGLSDVWHVPVIVKWSWKIGVNPLLRNHTKMMTSSNGNIFLVTGPLCWEFTGHRWIPQTKASGAELWRFLWVAPEPTDELTMETPLIWDAIALIMTSLNTWQCNYVVGCMFLGMYSNVSLWY